MNRMTVSEVIVDGRAHQVGDGPLPDEAREVATFGMLASPLDPFDPMDRAFTELSARLDRSAPLEGAELIREYPLSPETLALSHVWRVPWQPSLVVAAKGAPEAIAELCGLGADEAAHLTAQVERATADGQRVLAVARASWDPAQDLPAEQHGFDFTLLGLVGLRDPVRPGVAEAVAECTRAGVRTVMITGDYPGTALAIAREIGLESAAGCLTGPEVQALSDDELAQRVQTVSVFARMVPDQKLRLVRALQATGAIVGMTGDGVNDAPALRAADIGIAMGARGTDVAREAAALVITDDDFGSIVGGIRQGRGIFDNLRKAMAYIIAVHVPIVGMAILPLLVTDWPLVLLPVQIAFLELIIDPACSVVFEAEQIDPQIMDHPPRPVGAALFDRRVLTVSVLQGLSVLAAVTGVYLWAVLGHRPDAAVRSVTFATLVLSNLLLIVVNRSWRLPIWRLVVERRNPTLKWIVALGVGLLGLLLGVPWLRDAFALGPVRPVDLVVAAGAAALGVTWFEGYKALGTRPSGRLSRSG
jgi:Ca2+-transporting ATPase